MRIKALAIACAIAMLSVYADAATIAGSAFAQFVGRNVLSTDGLAIATKLNANYSNLDPTSNAGAESAALGTLYYNGQFGSTNVPVAADGSSQVFTPDAGSLSR